MRRLFVALLTALTVVIGLATITAGTAYAAEEGSACTDSNGTASVIKLGVCVKVEVDAKVKLGADTARRSVPSTEAECIARGSDWRWDSTPAPGRCERIRTGPGGGPIGSCPGDRYPNVPGCQRGDRYDGPRYGSCAEYNRYGVYDLRRGTNWYNQAWDRNNNGIACDQGDVIVSSDGQCVTFLSDNRNYGNLYNRDYPVWDRLNGRSLRRENLSLSDRRDLERLSRQLNDYRGRWTSSRDQLRTICQDNTPPVTIINEAAPITYAAPAPAVAAPATPSAVSGSSIPQGSVNTGGDSVAFTLAHNRAV